MAAANTDLLRKATNNFSTTLGASIGATDTTISLTSTVNLPTDTAVDLVIDRVDINGNLTPSLREYVLGVVSSSTLITVLRGEGGSTAQSHATGAVVECVVTSETHNDMVSAILSQHNQNGSHGAITASSAAISGALTANSISINSGGTVDMSAATTTKYQPASVTSSALANGAVTPANLALTITTDANGWTVFNYGSWSEYYKTVTLTAPNNFGANGGAYYYQALTSATTGPVGVNCTNCFINFSYTSPNGNGTGFSNLILSLSTITSSSITMSASNPTASAIGASGGSLNVTYHLIVS